MPDPVFEFIQAFGEYLKNPTSNEWDRVTEVYHAIPTDEPPAGAAEERLRSIEERLANLEHPAAAIKKAATAAYWSCRGSWEDPAVEASSAKMQALGDALGVGRSPSLIPAPHFKTLPDSPGYWWGRIYPSEWILKRVEKQDDGSLVIVSGGVEHLPQQGQWIKADHPPSTPPEAPPEQT